MRHNAPHRRMPRNAGRPRPRAGRTPAPARPQPASGLDLALAAALAAPQPEPTTFAALGLPAPLVSALAERGIVAPFAIQASALPDALAGRDVLGKAETGSGKTLAFGLPVLARLAGQQPDQQAARLPGGPPADQPGYRQQRPRRQEKAPRALVLVPTRELAVQVAEVLEPLGRAVGVSVTTVYGGVSIGRQIDRMRRGVDIVVATPGRLIDLMDRGALTLSAIEFTVLDEADHMADLGFLPAVTKILDATPGRAQRLLFSATLDRGVGQLVTSYLSSPAVHAVPSDLVDSGTAEHSMLVLTADEKVQVAAEIAGRPARTLFFVRTKHGADRLARQFGRAGVQAAAIHGNLNQNQRQRALAGFAAGHPRVLVATDVAARGIHVNDVELVVHFDPPNDHKDYLHRSGRTARAGATGRVVALVEHGQVRDVERLQQAAGVTPSRHHVGAGHEVVREIATSGRPVPPPPPADPAVSQHAPGAAGGGSRPRRGTTGRDGVTGRGSVSRGAAGRAGASRGSSGRGGASWNGDGTRAAAGSRGGAVSRDDGDGRAGQPTERPGRPRGSYQGSQRSRGGPDRRRQASGRHQGPAAR